MFFIEKENKEYSSTESIVNNIQATMSIEDNMLDSHDICVVEKFLNNELSLEEAINIVIDENKII